MSETFERVCAGCEKSEEDARLEPCTICARWFCADCAVRAGYGRRFCSHDCARSYYFTGDPDDDEDSARPDDE